MLVDVVQLYSAGVRRARDEVRGDTPVRGVIDIDKLWSWRDIELGPVHAHLKPQVLWPLYKARVIYLRGRNLVIHGQQRAPVPGRRNAEALYEQMWWCRMVRE